MNEENIVLVRVVVEPSLIGPILPTILPSTHIIRYIILFLICESS